MRTTALLATAVILSACVLPSPYAHYPKRKLAEIEANPVMYQDQLFAFGGRVIAADKTEQGWVIQILTEDQYASEFDSLGSPLIGIFAANGPQFAREDHVQLLGYISEPISGLNLFGGLTRSVTMEVIAAHNETLGYAWHLPDSESLFTQWQGGDLFYLPQ